MKLEQWNELISQKLEGTRVRILESSYDELTTEGVELFRASGKKDLLGTIAKVNDEGDILIKMDDAGFRTLEYYGVLEGFNFLGYSDIEVIQEKKEETYTIQDLFEDYPEVGDIVEIIDTSVLSQSALADYMLHFDKVIGKVIGVTKWGSLAIKIKRGEHFGFQCSSHGAGVNTVPIEALKVIKKAGEA